MKRVTCLFLLLGLLAACEPTPKAPPVAAPEAPAAVPPVEAKPVVAAPEPAKPVAAVKLAAPAASPKPATKTAVPAAKVQAKPTAPAAKAQAALDLSVPSELLELQGDGDSLELMPLLPPLFVEKDQPSNPFQLSGRLISNERVSDYWDSIEGAELQIEFKQ